MKKIRFGSFPVISMKANERKCLDTYLIKSFADKIAISSTLGSISQTERAFITPALIRDYFKSGKYISESACLAIEDLNNKELLEEAGNTPNIPNTQNGNNTPNGKQDNKFKEPTYNFDQQRIRRAFNALKNLNKSIIENPFYRNNINYPIYIEQMKNSQTIDYDFLLLTNDLLNKSSIDEINYSDNITLIVLFLKIILLPRVAFSDLSTQNSNSEAKGFTAEVAKIIEYSQQKGTNPIALLFKLLISASYLKKKPEMRSNALVNGNAQRPGLVGFIKDSVASAFASMNSQTKGATLKFFDDNYSHLKSISWLLSDERTMQSIDQFFDDTDERTIHNHTGYVPNTTNETGAFADPIFRQYMVQKTEQYNSVLSFLNALYDFNDITSIYEDINISDTISTKIGNQEYNTDQGEIIHFIDTVAMECFMNNLRDEVNKIMNIVKMKSEIEISNQLGKVDKNKTTINLMAEYHSAKDTNTKAQILGQIENQKYRDMILNIFNPQNKDKNQVNKINLEFNLNLIQLELTNLYEATLVKLLTDGENNLLNKILLDCNNNVNNINNVNIIDDFKIYFENISKQINESIYKTIQKYLLDYINALINQLDNSMQTSDPTIEEYKQHLNIILTNLNNNIIKNQYITSDNIYKIFDNCFIKNIKNYFCTKNRIDLNRIKTSLQEKNPIIRKIGNPTESKKFKSFIFTKEILIELHELVYFYDTQRYIGGLINTVPSTKILNPDNKVKYILKRLGLDHNVVYIIDSKSKRIILQMPDFLSLTGVPLFESITYPDMESICKINWGRMWEDPSFNKMSSNNSANKTKLENTIRTDEEKLKNLLQKIGKETDAKNKSRLEDQEESLRKAIDSNKAQLQKILSDNRLSGAENLNTYKTDRDFTGNGTFDRFNQDNINSTNNFSSRNDNVSGHGFPNNINTNQQVQNIPNVGIQEQIPNQAGYPNQQVPYQRPPNPQGPSINQFMNPYQAYAAGLNRPNYNDQPNIPNIPNSMNQNRF